MGHCIGQSSHSGPISRGEHLAFSMRDRQNKPHITLEINSKGEIIEFKGKQNDVPIPSYMNHAVEFLNQKKDLWNGITDSTFWKGLKTIYNDEQILNFFIINNQELTNNVYNLLHNATDKDQMANFILKYKGDNLTHSNVYSLLYYATDKDQMANILGKKNIIKLTNMNVYFLLLFASDKDQMANILGKENIIKLTDKNVYLLLHLASDKDQMKNTLLKYIPKERINDIIKKENLKTELIPESRSVRNFRKTIRQLIKGNYK